MITAAKFPETAILVKQVNHALYNAVSAGSLSLTDTAPTVSFKLAITVTSITSHTDCGGTVTVNSEVKTFSTSGQRLLTATTLTSLPTITTANLDCNILIECINSGGSTITKESLTTIDVAWDDSRKTYWNEAGTLAISGSRVQTDNTTAVVNDIIRYQAEGDISRDWTIKSIQRAKVKDLEKFRVFQF